jgi:hypothetical protein
MKIKSLRQPHNKKNVNLTQKSKIQIIKFKLSIQIDIMYNILKLNKSDLA